MFGGGTLAIVMNPGALVVKDEDRDAFLAAIGLVAPGQRAGHPRCERVGRQGARRRSGSPTPSRRPAARSASSSRPEGGALAGWIEAEARERGLHARARAPPRPSPSGSVASSARPTPSAASRPGSPRWSSTSSPSTAATAPIAPDDVRALVAEAVPGSVWAFTDAVGERRVERALELLDRLLETTPEPVLLAVLHRRVRELHRDRRPPRARASDCPPIGKAMGVSSEFRMEKLRDQAKLWTTAELIAALDGLVELDAMVKGVPGRGSDRGAATAGVQPVGDRPCRPATGGAPDGQWPADQACSWTTRSLSMAKTQRPSPRSSSSIRSGSMYSCEQSSHRPPGMPKHSRSLRSGRRNVVSNRVVMSRRAQAGHRSRTADMPRL